MNHDSIAYYCSFVAPATLIAAVTAKISRMLIRGGPFASASGFSPPGLINFSASLAIATATTLIPIHGLPLGRYPIGFNANFSIPLLALLADTLVRNGLNGELLRARERKALFYSAALIGVVFYPLALGFGRFDPYAWGWSFSPFFVVAGIGAAALIWRGNRCGFILLAAIVAWQIGFLESRNYWDYLLDPIFFFCGVVITVKNLLAISRLKNESA